MSASMVLVAALVLTGPEGSESPGRRAAQQVEVDGCLVSAIDQVDVAAEEAGVVTEMAVREGAQVSKGDKLAQINDSKVVAAKKVAQAEQRVAAAEASSTVSVRYAQAAYKVAEYDYRKHVDAERTTPGVTPAAELKKLKLTADKAYLEIEKAVLEKHIAELTAESKAASVEAADDDIERRKVLARIDAMVIDVKRHEGEWVNPGDRLLRLLRMDKLKVEGTLTLSEVSPENVVGRPVTVTAELTGRREVKLPGKVVFVDPLIGPGGKFRVIADVENREENGVWLLLPGMESKMFVDAGMERQAQVSRRK
ncbi:MAG TPA: HlyD family efflux transporter periplasmic adaptor subunit [Pirellulales bacterium]|nr:HlyD family efflux transporter periplasmic adaptor subunit [Pirellulales bacterium]